MRPRSFPLIICCVLAALSTGHASRPKPQEPGPAKVRLGGAVFIPGSLTMTGRSTLTVSVATTASVPSVGADNARAIRAAVSISENNNFSGITYTVTPSRLIEVDLIGGGVSSTAKFEFTIDSQNTSTGTISYQAELVRLENAPPGVERDSPTTLAATLTVSAAPTPTPTPTPELELQDFCREGQIRLGERCISPVIIDTAGDGFDLTSAEDGVLFDLDVDGIKERTAWTAAGSDDAFLVLNRDGDDLINGLELFGNHTGPDTAERNGFDALAIFDRPVLGGNADGRIDADDEVFHQLRLWHDLNHDGVSDPEELSPLSEFRIVAISLDYKESRRRDRHGNEFRYRAEVYRADGPASGRWAYDVFLRVRAP